MKKNLLIVIAHLLFISSLAQTRVNRESLLFKSESEKIYAATGWSYNQSLGEWVEYKNVISSNKEFKTSLKSLSGPYMMSETWQNFISLQFKTVVYNSETYYILVIEKWKGEYKYPSIHQDWETFKATQGYIFTGAEYSKLKNITGVIELKTTKMGEMTTRYDASYDQTTFLDILQNEISRSGDGFYKWVFPLKLENPETIRFYTPSNFSAYMPYDFNKSYFEMPYQNFKKLLVE